MAEPKAGRVSPGRISAARALLDIEAGARAEEALAAHAPADGAERAFAWNLTLGVLRARPELDAVIERVARRPLYTLEPMVRALLRAGIWELRYSRVPPHAAVDQAVEASRRLRVGHAAGFINAVLRRQGGVEVDGGLGHPDWLRRRWEGRYGAEAARRWMEGNNRPAPIHLAAKEDPAGVSREFQHRGLTLTPAGASLFRLPPGAGAIPELPGYAEGRWWVMDPAAAAVADLIPADAGRALDCCAAPGGKSFRMLSRGLSVVATDGSAERLARVREGAARLGFGADRLSVAAHDWERGPLSDKFPAVLVDAPCTSLGLLGRHPDIRWARQEGDIAALAGRQRAILRHAAACVAPGGALVYAVCSPEPEEGPEVVASLGWPVEAVFSNAPTGGEDAFWACRMRCPG